ncbi:hypothetical protein LNTAR_13482 [Lentisphaera araneosa HTCC2155]|uniref:Uncharacterized protein n=1 Tax=Lentisphaera araneosa HTCC2155 TaxID=313628 RepID=A6DGU8_9BACT|nr:hypothetical protein [Lentisphaera araneosa]EDM28831.1 hypothetical protein LNTAR_13482 [Lentisphaera araneosa HTCC2155]
MPNTSDVNRYFAAGFGNNPNSSLDLGVDDIKRVYGVLEGMLDEFKDGLSFKCQQFIELGAGVAGYQSEQYTGLFGKYLLSNQFWTKAFTDNHRKWIIIHETSHGSKISIDDYAYFNSDGTYEAGGDWPNKSQIDSKEPVYPSNTQLINNSDTITGFIMGSYRPKRLFINDAADGRLQYNVKAADTIIFK